MSDISASPVIPAMQLDSAALNLVCFLMSFQNASMSCFASD